MFVVCSELQEGLREPLVQLAPARVEDCERFPAVLVATLAGLEVLKVVEPQRALVKVHVLRSEVERALTAWVRSCDNRGDALAVLQEAYDDVRAYYRGMCSTIPAQVEGSLGIAAAMDYAQEQKERGAMPAR